MFEVSMFLFGFKNFQYIFLWWYFNVSVFLYFIDNVLIRFVFFSSFCSRSKTACYCSNSQQPWLAQLCQKSVDKFKLCFRIFVDNIFDVIQSRSVVISLTNVVFVVVKLIVDILSSYCRHIVEFFAEVTKREHYFRVWMCFFLNVCLFKMSAL